MSTSVTRRRWLQLAAVIVIITAMSCSPTHPTTPSTTLKAIRYVRTRPVTGSAQFVGLGYNIPIPGDPYGRSRISEVSLRSVDGTTFVYDFLDTFSDTPVDTECLFWVDDQAVSPYYVATDIYVNETRIRVETTGNFEYGHFKVGAAGNVY